MSTNHFCTCKDQKCPFNPSNHNEGCDPCIKKNLRQGEIPSCFFKAISQDLNKVKNFKYEGFAKFVLEHQNNRHEGGNH